MICPRCKSKLSSYNGASKSSCLELHNGEEHNLVNGISCYSCGYWKDVESEPRMTTTIKGPQQEHRAPLKELSKADLHLYKEREQVDRYMSAGYSDLEIARLMLPHRKTTGMPTECNYRAAMRRYRSGRIHLTVLGGINADKSGE